MPTDAQIQEAQNRMDNLFSRGGQIQRPVSTAAVAPTITALNNVKTELDAIIALLES